MRGIKCARCVAKVFSRNGNSRYSDRKSVSAPSNCGFNQAKFQPCVSSLTCVTFAHARSSHGSEERWALFRCLRFELQVPPLLFCPWSPLTASLLFCQLETGFLIEHPCRLQVTYCPEKNSCISSQLAERDRST